MHSPVQGWHAQTESWYAHTIFQQNNDTESIVLHVQFSG